MKIVFLWLILCVQCSAVAAGDYEVLLEKLLNQLEDEEYKKTNLNDKRVDKKESSNYRNHKRNEIVDNETPDKAPNADQMRIEENGSERRPMVENANPDPLQKAMGFTDDEIMSSPKQTRRKRNLLHLQALWPKSKVPYKIDIAKFDKQSYIDAIENSINIVSNLTCVQFLPVSNALSEEVGHNNSVLFTSLNGCTSHVGMVGPGQSLSITPPGCIYTFVILHEMLHAVGLMHEHLRSDRDNYIRMVGDGLSEKSTDTINYSPYDLQSTMQYSLLNHATYETVMEAIDRNQEFLVSARKPDTLQFYDIMELIKMYNCAGHCVNPPVCIHGGFVNHKCVCYCPDHTSGDRCEVIETDSGCGGVIDVDVGQEKSIVSPNYPNNYNANQTCRWLFTGRPGYNLRITIDEMHLPYNVLDQCHHWLEIQYNNPGHPGILRCGEASGLTYTTSRDSPEILIVTLDSKQNPTKSTEKGVAFRVFLVGQYCLDNPCQYGICKENDQGYYCECESGFSGQHCDQVQASQSLSCDFDLEQSCFLGNTPNGDKFDWTIKKYTANYMDTGPKHAHSGHGFLLADMTPPQEKGDVTHLVSKIQFPEEDRCLSFYYNMHGSYVESLTVKTASGDGLQNPVWSASGNKGLSWHKAQIDIPASYDLKIIFEAVCGLNYSSAIALDTITLAPGNCDLANQEEGVVQLKTYSNNILLDLADYGFTFAGIGWINFAVQCCNTVTVKFKTAVTDDYYKLILGDSGNRWSHVRKYQNGQQTAYTYAVGKFLDCDENKKVWIGWKDDKLQVGTGLVYGENVLMTVPDDAPLDVQSVVISSGSTAHWEFVKGNCVSGFWKCSDTGYCVIPDERCNGVPNCSDDEQGCVFPECSENEFRCTYGRCYPKSVQCDGKMDCTDESDEKDCPIHIPPYNTVSTSSLGVSVQGKSAFKFTVKSCTDVWVKLWVNQAEIYSLGLGRGNNVFSSLHKTDGSSLSYYGEVLDCDRYLPFYVSWAGTHVTAGRGHTLDQDVMLQLEDASIPSIDEIKIGSYSKDVYFNLEAALPGCDSATEFRCEFGRCIPIADRCDGAPHCTDGTDEMDCPIQVPAWEHTFISQHGYNISGHEWLNFKAKGCSNAFVELYSKNERIYYVLLGRGQNEYSTLHNQLDAGTSKYKKLQVLDCNAYKDFWFSWKGDMVQVGQGLILGENIMFEFADSSLHLIDDVKLATWSDDIAYQIRQGNCFDGLFQCSESVICIPFEQRCNGQSNCAVSDGSDEENCDYPACDAETEFRCGYGRCYPKDVRCNEVMECSDGTDEHGCPIHTKPHQRKNIADYGYVLGSQTWINFKAKTCEEIQIRLYKNSQVIYKILLGRGRNSWSSLQVVGHKFTWKSGSIMKCDEYLPFWISWSNGDIKIGKGLNRHEDTYMSLSNQYSVGIDQMYIKSYGDDVFWFFEEGNCFPGLFQCTEEKECIPVKEICDGVSACAASGGSDEENCGPCSNDEFQCAFGLCIPSDKRCNGEDDCWDTSDEKNCPITVPVLHVTSYMDLGQYGINGAGRDTLIFTADACEDIWIGLMPDKSDTSVMYSIGIGRGGDTFNTVYKNGLTVKSTYTSELGCTTKELWLTWKNGKIAVGRGRDVTGPAFLEWTDTDPLEVNDIGLSSWNKAWIFQNIDV